MPHSPHPVKEATSKSTPLFVPARITHIDMFEDRTGIDFALDFVLLRAEHVHITEAIPHLFVPRRRMLDLWHVLGAHGFEDLDKLYLEIAFRSAGQVGWIRGQYGIFENPPR